MAKHQSHIVNRSTAFRLMCVILMPVLGVGCASSTWEANRPAHARTGMESGSAVSSAAPFQRPGLVEVAAGEDDESASDEPWIRTASHAIEPDGSAADTEAELSLLSISPVLCDFAESDEATVNENANQSEPDALNSTATATHVDGMTLEAFETIALQNNPAIRQASAAASQACGIRTQVGLQPNPALVYFGDELGNGGSGGLHGAYVTQMFVRGDKLCWNQQVVEHDVQAMLWDVEAQKMRVRTDIRLRFFDALAAQRREELAREFRAVALQGAALAGNRLESGFGNKADVLQSEIQVNEVDLLIRRAEVEFEGAWRELAAIAGVPGMTPTSLVGMLDVVDPGRDAESEYQQIVSSSPVLQAARQRVNRARTNLQRQQIQPISNVTGQFGGGYDDGTGDEFAQLQLSIPLPVRNRNQGNIHAAHSELHAAIQNVERLRLKIRADLAVAFREYQAALATVEKYETSILPRATETLELMNEAKAAGQFDFFRVLSARRAYFDAQLLHVAAQAEFLKASARMDGLLLSGSLATDSRYDGNDDLRGQALNTQ